MVGDEILKYPQEQQRRRIIEHSASPLWTDQEIYDQFKNYAMEYDCTMRLVRTKRLWAEIVKNRPDIVKLVGHHRSATHQ